MRYLPRTDLNVKKVRKEENNVSSLSYKTSRVLFGSKGEVTRKDKRNGAILKISK